MKSWDWFYSDLRTPAIDRDQAVQFASSIYRIVYEKTKENELAKLRLPKPISKSKLVAIVNALRHTIGKGHIHEKMSIRPGNMRKEEMYQLLLGTKNEPINSEDFLKIQNETLKLFLEELKNLKKIVDN